MEKTIWYLGNCSTCKRIMAEIGVNNSWKQIDIKEHGIEASELDAAADQLGGYEKIFSKRAMKYRSMGVADKIKSDKDYRSLMLEEYTFLKRPLVKVNGEYHAGNSKKVVEGIKNAL